MKTIERSRELVRTETPIATERAEKLFAAASAAARCAEQLAELVQERERTEREARERVRYQLD